MILKDTSLNAVSIQLCKDQSCSAPNVIKLFSKKDLDGPSSCQADCKVMSRAIAQSKFTGEYGEIVAVTFPNEQVDNAIIVGVGTDLSTKNAEELGGKIFKHIDAIKHAKEFMLIGNISDSLKLHIAHGMELASWKFDKYMSKKDSKESKKISICVQNVEHATKGKQSLNHLIGGVNFAKMLISEPANVVFPETFVEYASELKHLGVKITVLSKEEIIKNNMNSLMAVAKGSDNEPRVLILEWHGNEAKKNDILAIVGKGVTFDSGGINLKSSNALKDMKTDMSGAATVAAVIKVLAAKKAEVNVVAICGLVENMPSGKAQKVGDIVTSMAGTTIEVADTDAEGRMVLADCLTYVQEKFAPHTVIDLATLTGAVMVALGEEYAGLFSNDEELSSKLISAGEMTSEHLWRLPLCKKFEDAIESSVADIVNVGKPGTGAGSSTAAHFLKKFIKESVKWAHLDIAGTAYRSNDGPLHSKGATGFGVRLLCKFITDNLEQK